MPRNTTIISVIFDGQVLRPETPLDLEPNARYVVTIHPEAVNGQGGSAWDVLERFAGAIEAPEDWASEHDHYLYGTPKGQIADVEKSDGK